MLMLEPQSKRVGLSKDMAFRKIAPVDFRNSVAVPHV
jgi:hypothetical protein